MKSLIVQSSAETVLEQKDTKTRPGALSMPGVGRVRPAEALNMSREVVFSTQFPHISC